VCVCVCVCVCVMAPVNVQDMCVAHMHMCHMYIRVTCVHVYTCGSSCMLGQVTKSGKKK
jgi:hypothetical protein